ncbi:MAG: hypothetical protein QOA57_09100 [Nitrososphaeraceae archaeon]|nr:hypothetical protein [Nitrososphaeraceae archaeon]
MSEHKVYSICYRNTLDDTDCDGLADDWEKSGSYLGISMPGVNWQHKDILVEIDAMVSHANTNLNSAMDLVKTKFATAPGISNPDGLPGINLHVIFDHKTIPHDSCTDIWSEFQTLKNAWFGTALERASISDIVSKKQTIYHYGISLHSQCGLTGVSGNGEQPGNDIVISLGDSGWADSDANGHPDGNTDQKAATFMHELGHNLDLKHGGSANTPPCKPNYFSVMNPLYEFAGIVTTPIIDYSYTYGRDYQGHLIDETGVNGLHEPEGIVKGLTSTFRGAIGHVSPPTPPALFYRTFTANGQAINYDWPTDSDTTEMNVISSINFFKGYNPPCFDTTKSVSYGFKDWPNIKYWDPPVEINGFTKNMQFQTIDDASIGKVVPIGSNNTANLSEGTSVSQQPLSNQSETKLLDDPSLPPCDLSDPACTDSPCDPDDVGCTPSFMVNVTDPTNSTVDIGNRTAHSEPDISIDQIKNVSRTRIVALDNLMQSELFENATNQNNTEILNSLQKELITNSDSVVAHIQSNNYTKAMFQLLKLQSFIIQTNPEKRSILIQNEEATDLLKSLM